jgi:hypothetical protein
MIHEQKESDVVAGQRQTSDLWAYGKGSPRIKTGVNALRSFDSAGRVGNQKLQSHYAWGRLHKDITESIAEPIPVYKALHNPGFPSSYFSKWIE